MKPVIVELLTSKKFIAALAAIIVYVAGHFGLNIPPAALDPVWQILLVYVGAQGLADIGKGAKQASPGASSTTTTVETMPPGPTAFADVGLTTTRVVVEPPKPPPAARPSAGVLVPTFVALALGAGVLAPSCAAPQRAETIQTAQIVVTTAANGLLLWEHQHEIDLAKQGTPDQAAAALAAFRAKRAKLNLALAAAADAIIVAAKLNDQPSADGLAAALAEVIKDYQDLKGLKP